MTRHHAATSRTAWVIVLAAMGLSLLGTASAAQGRPMPSESVAAWVARHAQPLRTVDPTAPLGDLAPVQRSVGDATVVGLGESPHGSAEETTLKIRTLRLLVERMGFRSLAWEEDWTTGRLINAYLTTGHGDVDVLLGKMSGQWQTREVRTALQWLRQFNSTHADPVQFVGVEFYATPQLAYDDLEAYVAAAAPQLLDEVRSHLRVIRPPTADIYAYIEELRCVKDKRPYLRHARRLHELVANLPHRASDREHALMTRTARQIVSFYEHYALPEGKQPGYRDAHAAENLRWWRTFTGDKIAYWAGSPHTANAPHLRITRSTEADLRFASAGSYLREWYGRRYLSIGFTTDHGLVSSGYGQTVPLQPAKDRWFEHQFSMVDEDQFVLDLRVPAPRTVRRWLHTQAATRGLPTEGPDSQTSGGTLADWFDVIVHRQETTPTQAP